MKMLVIKTDENGVELSREVKVISTFQYNDYRFYYADSEGIHTIDFSDTKIVISTENVSKTFINK